MEANELMRYAYELLQGHSNEECARILKRSGGRVSGVYKEL